MRVAQHIVVSTVVHASAVFPLPVSMDDAMRALVAANSPSWPQNPADSTGFCAKLHSLAYDAALEPAPSYFRVEDWADAAFAEPPEATESPVPCLDA